MAVGKDREILAVAGEMLGKPGSGERIGQRIGGKARGALLAVAYDWRACRLHPPDRIETGGVLLQHQLFAGDLAGVVIGECRLQLGRTGQRTDGFGRDRHRESSRNLLWTDWSV
jgi:hypothetical protein